MVNKQKRAKTNESGIKLGPLELPEYGVLTATPIFWYIRPDYSERALNTNLQWRSFTNLENEETAGFFFPEPSNERPLCLWTRFLEQIECNHANVIMAVIHTYKQ